jgi:hypothetical protein
MYFEDILDLLIALLGIIMVISLILVLFTPERPQIKTTYITLPNGEVTKKVTEKSPKRHRSHSNLIMVNQHRYNH